MSNYQLPVLGFVACVLVFLFVPLRVSHAADLTSESDLMTRVKVGEGSSHTVTFVLDAGNTFAAGETMSLDFDEDGGGWVIDGMNATVADFGFNDGIERTIVGVDGSCTGHNGGNDLAVGINDTTGTITLTACASYTASASGAMVNIKIGTAAGGTDRITNPTATGVYTLTVGGTFGDTGEVHVEIVTDDQVVVTGTVLEIIGFGVSDTTIGFGTLSPTESRYATGNGSGSSSEQQAHTITVSTNAPTGYTMTIDGATLTSGANTINAIGATNTAPDAGAEQFGIRITAAGGSGTVSAPYDGGGFALDIISFPDEVATTSSNSGDTIYSMRYVANISESTEGGIYNADLVFTATGNI